MSIKFFPAGLPVTTSFTINAYLAYTASFAPPTASSVGYALQNFGATGSSFLTVQSIGLA